MVALKAIAAAVLLTSAFGQNTGGGGKEQRKPVEEGKACVKTQYNKKFVLCMNQLAADNPIVPVTPGERVENPAIKRMENSQCLVDYKSDLNTNCGYTPTEAAAWAMVKESAQQAMKDCEMTNKQAYREARAAEAAEPGLTVDSVQLDCRANYAQATGENLAAMEGAKLEKEAEVASLGVSMRQCKTENTTSACEAQLLASLNQEKGSEEQLTIEELRVELEQAGQMAAAEIIKVCKTENKGDEAAVKACDSNSTAMMAYANATGMSVDSVTAATMKQGARDKARKDVDQVQKACMETASTTEAKKACMTNEDVLRTIGDAEGKNASDVKDGMVKRYTTMNTQDDIKAQMKNCSGDQEANCTKAAKELLAQEMGTTADKISDDAVRMARDKSLAPDVAELMKACNETTEACRTKASKMMKDADGGKEPSAEKVKRMIDEGSAKLGSDYMEDCIETGETREECFKTAKSEMQKARGGENMTDTEAKLMFKEGAQEKALDSVVACDAILKENPPANATERTKKIATDCEDSVEMLMKGKGTSKGTGAKGRTEEDQGKLQLQGMAYEKAYRTCMENHETDKSVGECLKDSRAEDYENQLLGERQQAKSNKVKRDAKMGVLGKNLTDCQEEAMNDTAKLAQCDEDLKKAQAQVGITVSKEEVEVDAGSKDIEDAFANIDVGATSRRLRTKTDETSTLSRRLDTKTRKKQTDEECESKFGKTKDRSRYLSVKEFAIKRAAANAASVCKAAGETDADCEAVMKEMLETMSSTLSEEELNAIKPEIQAVEECFTKGEEACVTTMIDQLAAHAETDTACDSTTSERVRAAVADGVKDQGLEDGDVVKDEATPGASGGCVYKIVLNSFKANGTAQQLAKKAEEALTASRRLTLKGRSLLADVKRTGAAKDSAICGEDMSHCTPKAKRVKESKACSTKTIDETFLTCMTDHRAANPIVAIAKNSSAANAAFEDMKTSNCKSTYATSFLADCGIEADDNRLFGMLKEAARKTYTKCKKTALEAATADTPADTSACTSSLEQATGVILDEAEEALSKGQGMGEAIAEEMKTCMVSAGEDLTSCRAKVQASLALMRNKTVTLDQAIMELQKAGQQVAAELIKDCKQQNVGNEAASAACGESAEAKQAYADATGTPVGEVTKEMLMKGKKEKADEDVKEAVEVCLDEAATDAAKAECMTSASAKRIIALEQGRDASTVSDSEVVKANAKGQGRSMKETMKNCPDSAKNTTCKDSLKDMAAKAKGVDKSTIKDRDVDKLLNDAMREELSEENQVCMEGVAETDTAKKAACRDTAKSTMQSITGQAPSEAQASREMKRAGAKGAKKAKEACTGTETETECDAKVVAAVEKSLGTGTGSVTKTKAKKLLRQGAKMEAKDDMKACIDANSTTSGSATCDDVIKAFLETTGQTKHDGVKGKTQEADLKMEIKKEFEKEALEVCMDEHGCDATAIDACMTEQANAAFEDMAFPNAATRDAKKVQAKSEARKEYMGEQLQTCTEIAQEAGDAAAIAAAEQKCHDDAAACAAALGVEESPQELKQESQAADYVDGMAAATPAETTGRRLTVTAQNAADAADEDMKTDFAKTDAVRKFQKTKEAAMRKKAGSTLAACEQEGASEADCEDEAKEAVEKMRGEMEKSKFDSEIKPNASKMSEGLKGGKKMKRRMMQQVAAHVETTGDTCSDTNTQALADGLVSNMAETSAADVKKGSCLPGAGGGSIHKLHMKCKRNSTCNATAEEASTALESMRTGAMQLESAPAAATAGARRLAEVITDHGAAQDSALCADDDAACGTSVFSDEAMSPTPTPSSPTPSSPTPSVPSTTAAPEAGGQTSNAGRMAFCGAAALIMMVFFSA
jgi:hypothetical protein